MIIKESDFELHYKNSIYTLYLLNNKKEMAETSDKFKIAGYYTSLLSALKAILRFRQDKKYPGAESASKLLKDIKLFISMQSHFQSVITSLYDPIYTMKNKIIKYD
jgi:hypothetical protein